MRTHALAIAFLSCLFLTNVEAFAQRRADPFKPLRFLSGLEEAKKAVGNQGKIPVLVTFKRQPTGKEYQAIEGSFKGKFKAKYKIIPGAYAELTKGQINSLERNGLVKRVELDAGGEYLLDTATYWMGADAAVTDFGVDGTGVTIGMVDSGIDVTHSDIPREKILAFMDCRDSDNPPIASEPFDNKPHGTMCTSVAAGEGNANSIYKGVAPGAKIVGTANGDEYGITSAVIASIDWIVGKYNPSISDERRSERVRIITASWRINNSDLQGALHQSIINAIDSGIVFVAAAGNSGSEMYTLIYPASFEEVIAVGGLIDVGKGGFYLSPRSSRGPTDEGGIKPDIVVPYTMYTVKPGTTNEYAQYSGTSLSSPFVAGVVALMLEVNPNLTPLQIREKLIESTTDWGPLGKDIDTGYGRLDVYKAVDSADGSLTGTTLPVVPKHYVGIETLSGSRELDEWTLSLDDVSFPLAVTLISPEGANFDLYIYDGNKRVANATSTNRQDTVTADVTNARNYQIVVKSKSGSGSYFIDVSAGASGLVLTSDDDGAVVPFRDLAIKDLGPNSTTPGDINVFVEAENQGTEPEDATVTLSVYIDENTSLFIGTQTVPLGPGQQDTVTFPWTATFGTHTLEALVEPLQDDVDTDNNFAWEDVVVADTPRPTLTAEILDIGGPYLVGQRVPIDFLVTDGAAPVQGASVHVNVTTPTNKVYGFDGTTAANGIASLSFRTKKPDGTGTFTVEASATKEGYLPGYGWTTLEVVSP